MSATAFIAGLAVDRFACLDGSDYGGGSQWHK